jgi:RNA polymerase sigma factor (sigma-70 family)
MTSGLRDPMLLKRSVAEDNDLPMPRVGGGSSSVGADAAQASARTPSGCSDGAAYNAFLRKYHLRVYKTMLRRTRDPDTAEEVTQEAFARAAAYWDDKVHNHPNQIAWLLKVANNYYKDELRRWAMRCVADLLDAEGKPDLVVEPPAEPLEPQILAAIRGLPRRQQQVLLLKALGNLTIPEVADVLGIAVGTASSQLHRARTTLRPILLSQLGGSVE